MKLNSFLWSLILLCGVAMAQEEPDVDARWKDAQKRLNDAAREIADLSDHRLNYDLFSKSARRRAMLGVNIDTEKDSVEEGVKVLGVSPGGPAEEAGLKSGDVLLSLNHNKLVNDDEETAVDKLLDYMSDVQPGDTVNVEYLRGKQIRTIGIEADSVSSGIFSFSAPGGSGGFGFGHDFQVLIPDNFKELSLGQWGDLRMVTLSKDLGEYFGVDEGLLVVSAPEDDTLQLRDGDVILNIDGREPGDPRHAIRILRSYRGGEKVSIGIVRKKKRQKLDLELPKRTASNGRPRLFFSAED